MRTALAFTLALTLSLPGLLPADSARGGDLGARVAAVLDRFPANDAAARDALCAELVALGPGAVAEVATRVRPPGDEDDSRARFALSGLAVHVTRPGAETERLAFARSLLAALDRAGDDDVAAFLLSQVQVAGRAESVRSLERYLVREALAGPAAAALVAIGGREAEAALLRSLDRAPRAARLALIQALGELRSRGAVERLLPLADDPDEAVRQAARFALASAGEDAAGPALATARLAASPRERAQALPLYLLHARRLAESGHAAAGVAVARGVLEHYRGPGEAQHAAAALELLISSLGERALPEVLAAADDPALRGAALALADRIPGDAATARWVEAARGAGPETRAGILDMLGRRGDASALPFVRESLRSRDPAVRRAAVPAAARLGGDAVLPDLLARLHVAAEDEVPGLETALVGFPAARVVPEAVRVLDRTPLPGKAALVRLLGAKGAREKMERLFALAAGPEPETRAAAFVALGRLAGEDDLPRLAAAVEAARPEDRPLAREALGASIRRNPDVERRADGLLALLAAAPPAGKVALLDALPEVGGAKALRAVVGETASSDAAVRSAAVLSLARWPEHAAADELLRLAKATPSRDERALALGGYLRLVGRVNMPAARRLALYEDLLALPGDEADRAPVLAAVAAVREPESLRLLARHLDHPVLHEAAASSLLELLSRQSARERWPSGHEAHSVLRRVEESGTDPAVRARAGEIVRERLAQGGFLPLFDGRSLDGWRGAVAGGLDQAAADEAMLSGWRVVDGALAGGGGSLSTVDDYADFELLVEWRIGKGGDGGIRLRGAPQVLVRDSEVHPEGSGGLLDGERQTVPPSAKADRPAGEWNRLRIFLIGERVTVYLNDRRVVDNRILERQRGSEAPAGPIGLVAHRGPLLFRHVFVREIPRDEGVPAVTEVEAAEGFYPLFNGRDLEGWTGGGGGYAAEGGRIVVRPERGGGNLLTEREYADFVLRFEFRLTPAANNGLGVRAPLEGDAAYAGMEIQILEDGSPVYWDLKPWQYHGSVYGVVAARRGAQKPVGEWNEQEVTVKGRKVTVVVNGTTVVDADLDAASAGGTIDGRDHPGLARASGRVGFLGHGSALELRNIRIRELP
jgi:HEAT repeat protein